MAFFQAAYRLNVNNWIIQFSSIELNWIQLIWCIHLFVVHVALCIPFIFTWNRIDKKRQTTEMEHQQKIDKTLCRKKLINLFACVYKIGNVHLYFNEAWIYTFLLLFPCDKYNVHITT